MAELLNAIEAIAGENATLRADNQRLRDEIARLKGSSPKPDIKPPSAPPAPRDHSSEVERRVRTPRGKRKKNAFFTPTRYQPCAVDRSLLPPGAVALAPLETLVQDIIIEREVIGFVREVWQLPSGKQLIAPLPEGYHGGFGPNIRTSTISLAYDANVSQPALLRLYRDVGIDADIREGV